LIGSRTVPRQVLARLASDPSNPLETPQASRVQAEAGMGARTFTELDVWRLSNELKLGVYHLARQDKVARDIPFRDQICRAAASVPANIAEGFGRYQPREFMQYLRVANGSLMEVSNHLRDGVDRGHFSAAEAEPLLVLARRASAAATRLIRYLRTAKPPHQHRS